MRSFKSNLLAGASALLAVAAFGAPASAQVTISGGGSSLIAPYLAESFDCHAPGNATLIPGTITSCPVAFQDTTGPDGTNSFIYQTASSGVGIQSYLQETNGVFGFSVANPPSFAASDSALTGNRTTAGSDIGVFYLGGTSTRGGYPVTELATAHTNLIQIPLSIDPVALAYNPKFVVAGVTHYFTINKPDHRLHLDADAYCRIFNGLITDWNAPALTTLNNNQSLTGGVTVPIVLEGRSDSSGTTEIFTRHLAAACTALLGSNTYTAALGTTTLPNSLFVTTSGSVNLSIAINSTDASIGYIGADYVLPGSANSGATPGFSLVAATVQNPTTGTPYHPSSASATLAFSGVLPPSGAARTEPQNWVPTLSIANPADGYPFIGTTNGLFYQHYADPDVIAALAGPVDPLAGQGFLTWYYEEPDSDGLLTNVGLAPLPSAWKTAIDDVFITDNAGLHIHIH